jgi:broad specificity phosphatase PhoE
MASETEVLVIDAPQGAARALGAFRPQLERTHLICRWPGELAPAFRKRVSNYLAKVRRSAEVVALTLVIGGDATVGGLLYELGQALAEALAPTGSLTLLGVDTSQNDVVESFEVLRQLVAPSVTLDAWFGAG